ncbi:MAG TPA: hypothetical protein VF867_07875 [Arthrobacter sp.]
MTTVLEAPTAPAIGVRYLKQSTGRAWHVVRICNSGLIALSEEFYGPECEMREYVTRDELAGDYAPAS